MFIFHRFCKSDLNVGKYIKYLIHHELGFCIFTMYGKSFYDVVCTLRHVNSDYS